MKRFIIEMQGRYFGWKGEFYKNIADAKRFSSIDEAWKVCNAIQPLIATVRCLSDDTMKRIDELAVGI